MEASAADESGSVSKEDMTSGSAGVSTAWAEPRKRRPGRKKTERVSKNALRRKWKVRMEERCKFRCFILRSVQLSAGFQRENQSK